MRIISFLIGLSFLSPVMSVYASVTDAQVPRINLEFWNDDKEIRWDNNCYNYSTNRVTNSFAQPGEASGINMDDYTCEIVMEAASADLGLLKAEYFTSHKKREDTLIALVVAPGIDFHWYRRDDNNMWSHKPGATPATDKDQKDKAIYSPETADRGWYTDFCGYFSVKNYLKDPAEQNAGYVRIGNMPSLPVETTTVPVMSEARSEVEVLMYSGRRNPILPLESVMKVSGVEQAMFSLRDGLPAPQMTSPLNVPSKLGYNGILIRDEKGLVFEKGTHVYLKNDTIAVQFSDGRSVQWTSELVAILEKHIFMELSLKIPSGKSKLKK